LELAYVACGRTDSIFIPGAKPWDVAAGTILVREAGGRVTDAAGLPWDLESRDMIAANGLVHRSVLDLIKKVDK
jgi:myo-inositol-1(or 4)-monophosphatase